MSETNVQHLTETEVLSGVPRHWRNPVKSEKFAGKHEASLGKQTGVNQFGVNHVTLDPGAWSSLRHWHEGEDEFVYVLDGTLTLRDENGAHAMMAGSYVGFPAGIANGHHLVNESKATATFVVVGSRASGGDVCHYPDGDLGPDRR
ncbi:MAG: cupin domain-containing protein [Pseudomonadota bacterium]